MRTIRYLRVHSCNSSCFKKSQTVAWRVVAGCLSSNCTTSAVLLQVCDREDSETYAKRTITEIETCLGFTFHGAAEEEAPETITNAELEVCRRSAAAWQQRRWQ
jgi:hypothetical protein